MIFPLPYYLYYIIYEFKVKSLTKWFNVIIRIMKKLRIVIIGAGFGGTVTAKNLKKIIKSGRADVTIINPGNYFVFTPLLHEVATCELSPDTVLEPIKRFLRHSCVSILKDRVERIDPKNQRVYISNGSIPYDYLVVSSGSETNYYGIPGAKENSFTLKDLDDAVKIKNRLLEIHGSCVIVGAGATGVELAAEISEFKKGMRVSLVTSSPDVLPQFPAELRVIAHEHLLKKGIRVMTNETVVEVKPGKILFSDKSFVEAELIIWVAGVKPLTIEIPGIEKEKNGRLKVDEFLRITPDIFSLGDVAGTSPMLAQVAVQQGVVVAKNIIATLSGEELIPFKFKEKGLLVSLGHWFAVGKIFGVVLRGPVMWWIWRTVYLFNFHSWSKRFEIAWEWTLNIFNPRKYSR